MLRTNIYALFITPFLQKRLWSFVFVILSATGSAVSQELPNTIHFTNESYGSQSQNWDLCTLPDGTVFIANNGGLLEFDGARWYNYQLPDRQVVRAVAAMDGKVYVGGFAEFGYFVPDLEKKWRYVSLSENLNTEVLRTEEIWHILAHAPSGNVFFQSFSTIFKYDGNKVEQITPPANIMFLENVAGRLLFPAIGSGLYELLQDGGFRYLEGSEILAKSIVTFLLPKGKDSILVGTRNEGLFIYTKGTCQAWPNEFNKKLRQLQPNKAATLHNGSWCIGTIREGVFVFDKRDSLVYHLESVSSLQNNTVLALKEGLNGELWIGLDKGVDCVELNSPLLRFIDRSGTLGTTYAASYLNGFLYLGTNQGLFVKRWPAGAAEDFKLIDGTQGQVWSLYNTGTGLLCGHNEGTFLIHGKTATRISEITGGWTFAAAPSDTSFLLEGTYTGIVVFKKTQNGWEFKNRIAGFQQAVKYLYSDNEGYWWAAHSSRGLWRLKINEDFSKVIEIKRIGEDEGLLSDFNLRMYKCGEELLINDGERTYHPENGNVVAEENRDIKICFQNGYSVKVSSNNVEVEKDKVKENYFLTLVPGYERVIPLTDSLLLFCLEDGYALLPMNKKRSTEKKILGLRIAAIEILVNPTQRYYPTDEGANWQTPANKNNFRILLATPAELHQSTFTWSLEGPSTEYFQTEKPEVELTGLFPGQYRLTIVAKDNADPMEFDFEVLPHWWQKWWAMLLWFLMAGGLIFLMEKLYRMRLRRHQVRMQSEKLKELEAQRIDMERKRLAAEVHNKTRELSNSTINLIRKNEALTGLLEEMKGMDMDSRSRFRLKRLIENHLTADEDWNMFEKAFNQVHDEFFTKLKQRHPQLTPGDLRLASFLKLNLSSKEIASLLGISVRGVENKRYRLRRKLNLSTDSNLTEHLIQFQ